MGTLPVNFTKYTSKATLTKGYELGQGSKLIQSKGLPQLYDGWAQRMSCDFSEFGSLLGLDDAHSVLGYGILAEGHPDKVRICMKKMLGKGSNFDAVSRSLEFFSFPIGVPGVVMLDYDPDPRCKEMTPQTLIAAIDAFAPSFAGCMKWVMPSVSSGVRRACDPPGSGTKKGGFHLYIAVPDLSDTKRFGDALCKQLWLAGFGYHKIGRDGGIWLKCAVDVAPLRSPERIDYVGAPILGPGLACDKVPVAFEDGWYFNTKLCFDLSNPELEDYSERVRLSALGVEPEAKKVRDEYRKNNPTKKAGVAKRVKAGQDKAEAEADYDRILAEMLDDLPPGVTERWVDLPPDYVVEGAYLGKIEVRDLLKRGAELDGEVLFDPRETGDYGYTTAMFFWNGGKKPIISSFAHGGGLLYFLHDDVLEGVASWFRPGCLVSWTDPPKGEPKLVRPIDSLAAERFAACLADHYAWSAPVKTAYRFTGSHWAQLKKGEWEAVGATLMRAGCDPYGYTSKYMSSVWGVLESSGLLPLPDPAEGLIPFANGLLHPLSKKFAPTTKDNAYTWSLPWAYEAKAECPFFMEWLQKITDNDPDTMTLTQAFFNACLVGRSDLQKFLFVKGDGGTGKGTLLRILEAMLGKDNCATTELKILDDSRFEAANIVDKRLVSISEAERYKGSMMKIKALTGQDSMRCEGKFLNGQTQRIFKGMVLIISNEQPGGTDYTSGFFRRLIVLKLNKRFSEAERAAFAKKKGEDLLHKEIPGIVNWALSMPWDAVSSAFYPKSGSTVTHTMEALVAQNPVTAYVRECLVPIPERDETGKKIAVKDRFVQMGVDRGMDDGRTSKAGEKLFHGHETYLYPNYLQWCKRTHRSEEGLIRFSDELEGVVTAMGIGKKHRLGSGKGFIGFQILPDDAHTLSRDFNEKAADGNLVKVDDFNPPEDSTDPAKAVTPAVPEDAATRHKNVVSLFKASEKFKKNLNENGMLHVNLPDTDTMEGAAEGAA